MGSEGNKINDGTSFQPSETALCANGCGFFGTAATMNMCSKCFRDLRVKEEQAAAAKAAMEKLVHQNQTVVDGSSLQSHVGPSSSAVSELPSAVVESVDRAEVKVANRCSSCRKRVGVMGFMCKCGKTFCGTHRYPEKHDCGVDFKAIGRDAIAKANPVVRADKVERF